MSAIGPQTLELMSRSGPEMKAQLLEKLELNSFMVTDGHNPVNLFDTANGLIAGAHK